MIVTASDLLKSSHPLHSTFVKWVNKKDDPNAKPDSKRQAQKFLTAYPQYNK